MLPKKVWSAYFIFQIENLKSVIEKEKIKPNEATKRIGEIWKALPEKRMKVYEKRNMLDRKRYDK